MKTYTALACVTMCLVLSGCVLTPEAAKQPMKWPWAKDKSPTPYPNPVKMAVTWTPDILIQSGRTPTRGFGGRVYFYNDRSQAVPVEGELTVHGFAAEPSEAGNGVKRFRFTSEQFTRHFSESDLGASYSIWIPWDASGGEQKKLSLIPTFKTAGGKIVQGDAAVLLLPGKKPDSSVEVEAAQPEVRQVGHFVGTSETDQGLTRSSKMQTTTIPLPKTFQHRLARMPEQTRPTVNFYNATPPSYQIAPSVNPVPHSPMASDAQPIILPTP